MRVDNITDEIRERVRREYPGNNGVYESSMSQHDIIRTLLEEFVYWGKAGNIDAIGAIANVLSKVGEGPSPELESFRADLAQREKEAEALTAELEAGKAILIGNGYEENELRFMVEEVFEMVLGMQTAMLRMDAELASNRAALLSVGEAVKARAVEIVNSYRSGLPDDMKDDNSDGDLDAIAAEIESISLSAIVGATGGSKSDFREYLEGKLKDPEFRQAYKEVSEQVDAELDVAAPEAGEGGER